MGWNRDRLEAHLGRRLEAGELRALDTGVGVGRIVTADVDARARSVLAQAAVPLRCGEDIVPAPARGPMRVFAPMRMVAGSTERQAHDGWMGRDAACAADVFDRMAATALRRGEVAPFSHGQVAMARQYRAMVERHEAGGMRCASLEAGRAGGGGGGFIDAFVAEGRRIEALHRRIGAGVAMELRRIRPSARGSRRSIRDRALVDAVCLRDMTLSDVLRLHGWSIKGEHRAALRRALAAVLDRMQGYGCARPQNGG